MAKRGLYIVIEGSDGTGKSTQAVKVTQWLQELGLDPLVVKGVDSDILGPVQEPGGTARANELNKLIKDKTIPRTPWQNIEWFTEARQSTWNELIKPALDAGKPVVTSRSWVSTVAYQGYGEGVDIDKIESFTKKHVGEEYMNPDLVLILAITDETARKQRIKGRNMSTHKDTFESMPKSFQSRMQDGYVRFAKKESIPIIDAGQTPDEVFSDIRKYIEPLLKR